MFDIVKDVFGTISGFSPSQWGIGALVAGGMFLFTRKMPKKKFANWINLLSEYFNGVVRVTKISVTAPSKFLGVQFSAKILKYIPKKIAGPLEEGFFVTIAYWLKEAWKVIRSFVNEIMKVPEDIVDAFIEGLLSDNEKKK